MWSIQRWAWSSIGRSDSASKWSPGTAYGRCWSYGSRARTVANIGNPVNGYVLSR